MDAACSHYHASGDAHRAMVMMPRCFGSERNILEALRQDSRYAIFTRVQ